MPHSHHSHSGQFCKHASGRLEEVVLEAIHQGFEVYGLTEHAPRYRLDDLYPEEEGMDSGALMKQYEDFLDEAHRLKALYASQITLLVGLETEYISDVDLDGLSTLLEKFGKRVEYVVGSIHHVRTVPIDFDIATFDKALDLFGSENSATDRHELLFSDYFDAQYTLLQRFKPEIIGHFDLCRMFTPQLLLSDYSLVWSKVIRNIRYAVSYGALFEVNAAAFRKKWETAYPGEEVLKAILGEGGRFALSDDSHGPHAVGLNYGRTADYLKSAGVFELWYLQRSKAANRGDRLVEPKKLEGDWREHSFWKGKA
ncbi:histidinol-phosphatase [Ephemerocybe angulata]|uniref:Histidinol-phosphatase n=1 Tax=Ephemerocybe angulata TaxID=980116 RepID=A0A8H6IC36_9AGAR|nr:histidinol-phosphatase [Tulosesus angulatus]